MKKDTVTLLKEYADKRCSVVQWDKIINQHENRVFDEETLEQFVSIAENWIFVDGKIYNFKKEVFVGYDFC